MKITRSSGGGARGEGALKREPAFDPLQRELFDKGIGRAGDLLSGGMGAEDTALLERGRGALSDALSGYSPDFINDIFQKQRAPQAREFEERTLPGIRESLVSSGDFWSTGRADKEIRAREGFQERMESQLADLFLRGRDRSLSALPMVSNITGIEQRSEIERLNAQMPWLNLPTEVLYGEPTGAGGTSGRIGVGSSGGAGVGTSRYPVPQPPNLRDQLIEAGVWGAGS